MHSDHYYEVGTSHTECQDYALSGTKNGLSWAIVSDGCSLSKNTDVGARILAHAAESTLVNLYDRGELLDQSFMDELFSDIFRRILISKADTARNSVGLGYDALDATVLMAYAAHREDESYVWGALCMGDGDVLLKYPDGYLERMKIRYDSNAPYYPSYAICKEKCDGYMMDFGPERKRLLSWHRFVTAKDGQVEELPQAETSLENPYSEISGEIKGWIKTRTPCQLVVSTDGIDSYGSNGDTLVSFDGTNTMPMLGFVDYKSVDGQFVKRRMRALGKSFSKVGVSHYDDIACAAITFVEEE